jgi:hypothetical protein
LFDSTLAKPRRDPGVTLGSRLGDPWVTQAQTQAQRLGRGPQLDGVYLIFPANC